MKGDMFMPHACRVAIRPVSTMAILACDTPTNLPACVRPKFAYSQTEVGHAPDRGCGAAGPSDLWPDSFDTTARARTEPADRPAHNSPRRYPETSGPMLSDGRASGFVSQGVRQHMLVEQEFRNQPFQPAVLFFQLSAATELARAEMDVFLLRRIERRFGHALAHPGLQCCTWG
jgi:hypothetical protein